jgi:hypothetical protein
VAWEKIGMVSSDDGSVIEHMPLPLDWICRELVHSKDDVGTRVAVVALVDVLYSEGVYLEDSISRRGMLPPEAMDAPKSGIVNVDSTNERPR